MKGKHTVLILMLQMPIWLSACSYDYHIKDEDIVRQQRERFVQLCNAKDRSIIYQTAQVDGYLSASRGGKNCRLKTNAWEPIVKYGYNYSECTTAKVTDHRLPDNANIYQFTLESKGSTLCGAGDKYYYTDDGSSRLGGFGWVSYFIKEHQAQLQGKCLVVKKVDKPMSQYMLLTESWLYDENGKLLWEEFHEKYKGHEPLTKKGLISVIVQRVINMQERRILSQNLNYSFYPKGRQFSYSSGERCSEEKHIRLKDVLTQNSKHQQY